MAWLALMGRRAKSLHMRPVQLPEEQVHCRYYCYYDDYLSYRYDCCS
mgnify:CR=1 FL=1